MTPQRHRTLKELLVASTAQQSRGELEHRLCDLNFPLALKTGAVKQIDQTVNAWLRDNRLANHDRLPLDRARWPGAKVLFGGKALDPVCVVSRDLRLGPRGDPHEVLLDQIGVSVTTQETNSAAGTLLSADQMG